MGSILTFRQRKPSAAASRKRETTPATIIIFPGVRYERTGAPDGPPKWSPAGWMAPFQPQPLPTP